jgi:hypothetical protein
MRRGPGAEQGNHAFVRDQALGFLHEHVHVRFSIGNDRLHAAAQDAAGLIDLLYGKQCGIYQ